MSRKDYVEAARIIREASYLNAGARALVVSALVTFFAEDNPRFSPSRFREACAPLVAGSLVEEREAGRVRTPSHPQRTSQQPELEAV